MSQLIYIASPYSHADRDIRIERFEAACRYAAELMLEGTHVFSPIAHTHPIAEVGELPKGFGFWREYDEMMIGLCSAIHVLMLDGWRESVGVSAEIAHAGEIGIDVEFIEPRQSP